MPPDERIRSVTFIPWQQHVTPNDLKSRKTLYGTARSLREIGTTEALQVIVIKWDHKGTRAFATNVPPATRKVSRELRRPRWVPK